MIEYHADDYGLFPEQSRRILDTIKNGVCNGISIMPNSSCLDQCMEMLFELDPERKIRISLHLNLVEGAALADPGQISMLIDKKGLFCNSFEKLFILSFLPGRNQLKKQIETEFAAQIRRCKPYLKDSKISLDSHTHIHMIPLVFTAMINAAQKENAEIERIRIPSEQWKAYQVQNGRLKGKKIINYLKAMLLNVCAWWNCRRYSSEEWIKRKCVFAGVLCSGRMDSDVIENIVPNLIRIAERNKSDLELLFHPGGVYENKDLETLTFYPDRVFLSDSNRRIEAEALKYKG